MSVATTDTPTTEQVMAQFRRGISKTPGVCGGAACIDSTRIPVWLLVEYRRNGAPESQILTAYPALTAADLVNAWAYADAHLAEIENLINLNTHEDQD